MHDPVLTGWCMVVTTKSMVETTQKQPSNRFKNTRLLLAWNNQPIFALEQPCLWVVTWLEFLYGGSSTHGGKLYATSFGVLLGMYM